MCHHSKIYFTVKHLWCYEVYHQPSPSHWVVGPWHMLLGIKPDRNHGYWTQKNYCGSVFDPSVCCVHVCVCLNSVWTAWCLWKLSSRGTKAQPRVWVCPSPWERRQNNNSHLPQVYILCNSPFCFPRLIVFPFNNSPLFPVLEFKTGRSEESMAGVFCTSISLVPIPLRADW